MRAGRVFAVLLVALVSSGCNPFPKTWEWNQKLTVEVTTPDGVKSGSAVTNVRWGEENSVGNYPSSYRGEATVVDLGNGRYLFALLGEPTKWLGLATFEDLGTFITEEGFAAMAAIRETREVPRKLYPLLVTFADINNPKTVRKVDPDNLAAAFGPGVKLRRMTLTITDEAATEGTVEKVLPWLAAVGNGMLDGTRISDISAPNRLANDLTRLNFRSE